MNGEKLTKRKNSGKPGIIPRWLVAIVDVSLVSLGFYLAFISATGELQGLQIESLIILSLPLLAITVLLFGNLGLYSQQRSGIMPIVRALITGVIVIDLLGVMLAFWTRAFVLDRLIFLLAPLYQLLLLLGWRILFWYLEMWIHGQKKLLVIGSRRDAERALQKIMSMPKGIFEVIRVLPPAELDSLPDALEEADAVMIAGSLAMEEKNLVVRESFNHNREVFIIPDLYEIILTRAMMTQVDDTPVIECHDMQLDFLQLAIKRTCDLIFALVLGLVSLPVLLLMGLVIRLDSRGPAIYNQERVGLGGKRFTLYKLRTMLVDAEEKSGPVLSNEEDDRVTRIGRFLRASRLDELPQLYNVLRGDLSIVGPRPERPYFVERFQQEMPEYGLRHLVKPGITGLAQVAGYYATNTQDKLRYDLYYVADYSLFLDFRILLLTVPTIFNRESARGLRKEIEERADLAPFE
ncbi:MAG: sugar transferase [Bacillota bacterium]|nr:sugar transferase [Bacillota bacterium]